MEKEHVLDPTMLGRQNQTLEFMIFMAFLSKMGFIFVNGYIHIQSQVLKSRA